MDSLNVDEGYSVFGVFVLTLFVLLGTIIGIPIGLHGGKYGAVESYCAYNNSIVISYDWDYYCMDSDNQLHKIEWLED